MVVTVLSGRVFAPPVYFTFTFIMGNGDATRTLNISTPAHISCGMEHGKVLHFMHLDDFDL